MYFNGVNAYVVIPLTVYGWSAITIQEWIYFYKPKVDTGYGRSAMIGSRGTNLPCIQWVTENKIDYTWIRSEFFVATPDGTGAVYIFDITSYVNVWANFARRYDNSSRILSHFVNGVKARDDSIPSDYVTILDFNPDTYVYPDRYKRLVLGATTTFSEPMKMMQYQLLIYTSDLTDSEIAWNVNYPENPVRNGLYVWLQADPNYVKDIDGDGILEWVDLSGFGNHGKIYNAQLVQLIKTPSRLLSPVRTLQVVR
jgi:hypothetical protein